MFEDTLEAEMRRKMKRLNWIDFMEGTKEPSLIILQGDILELLHQGNLHQYCI